jgi:hypothetical protein
VGSLLRVRKLRDLDLVAGSEPGRPGFLSAASGLVHSGSELYVVADDELHLARFPAIGGAPGHLLRLFKGELPHPAKQRKQRKPDLEILARLPSMGRGSHGALLALGSGSGVERRRGSVLPLDASGHIEGVATAVDASPLFEVLARQFDDLNLEGAWVHGPYLYFLQRGNQGKSPSAVLGFDFEPLAKAMQHDAVLPPIAPRQIVEIDLGQMGGVVLSFSDASPLTGGHWVFSAIAENTADSRADGPCVGAAVGLVDESHRVQWMRPIAPLYKIEGIHAAQTDGTLQLLLVSDADDPTRPASLLSAIISP